MQPYALPVTNRQVLYCLQKTYGKRQRPLAQDAMARLAHYQKHVRQGDVVAHSRLQSAYDSMQTYERTLNHPENPTLKDGEPLPLATFRFDISWPANKTLLSVIIKSQQAWNVAEQQVLQGTRRYAAWQRDSHQSTLGLLRLLSQLISLPTLSKTKVTLDDYLGSTHYDKHIDPRQLFQALQLPISPYHDKKRLYTIAQRLQQKMKESQHDHPISV